MLKQLLSTALILTLAGTLSAQTYSFGMDGSQQTPPVATTATGTCTVTLDISTGAVSIAGTYTGLTSSATAGHLHGPAPVGGSAGIVIGLGVTGGTTGSVFGGGTLSPAQVTDMLNGLHYVNIHNGTFPNGEIRGQVAQAAIVVAYGGNPAGSLSVLAGSPTVGGPFALGIDNPLGTQPAGSFPFLGVSTGPDPLFAATGTGFPIPGWGMGGPTGEILILVGGPNPVLQLAGPPWAGPLNPAPVQLPVPPLPSLIGVDLFLQGVMVNPFGGGPTFGLTNGLQITIGS